MARKIEYPRASLTAAIEVGNAVYELGGRSTMHTCADKMNKKIGGGFQAVVSAADKFGFIDSQRGDLSSTELFNQYKHAYSDEEEQSLLRRAFLSSGVFHSLYERFRGREVPDEILDRILVREFDVPTQAASRISGYFTQGAKQVGLLGEDNQLLDMNGDEPDEIEKDVEKNLNAQDSIVVTTSEEQAKSQKINPDTYSIQFCGPGINSTIEVHEKHDLIIVDAILQKIKAKLELKEDEL